MTTDIVHTNKGRGPLLHWCTITFSELGPPMNRFQSEELVDKIDYAARHDLMGTADLSVGPEIDIRLRYDERYAIQPHNGAWSVVYTVEFGKKSPWVEADHRSLVSAVSKVLGRVGHYGVAFKEVYVGR